MRILFIISSILFWLLLTAFWIFHILHDHELSTPAPFTGPASNSFTLEEVMQHGQTHDCWMAIEGRVYDVTSYLPSHPTNPEIVNSWCGKEATHAWQTKTRGRPHSDYAVNLLQQLLKGNLAPPP